MNKVILMGRLTRDPEVRYSTSGDTQLAIARYTLAVDRRFKRLHQITIVISHSQQHRLQRLRQEMDL